MEHNVTTMVRLSGQESLSWQYWPADTGDKTLSFGYMSVTLLNRETRVSYVKRDFKVNNTKVRYDMIQLFFRVKINKAQRAFKK